MIVGIIVSVVQDQHFHMKRVVDFLKVHIHFKNIEDNTIKRCL